MKRKERVLSMTCWGWTLLALVGFALAGCGGDDESPASFDPPPGTPTYENGDDQVTLSWGTSPSAGADNFAGYDVFRDTATMVDLNLADLTSRKLNANPLMVRSYIDATAVNGTKYYYSVRSVKDNGDWSKATPEIDTSPVETGDHHLVLLAEFADGTRPNGLDLSQGIAVAVSSSDPDNTDLVDVYLGTAGDNDEPTQQLALKSPNLVLNGSPDWTDRVAGLKIISAGDATTDVSGWSDKVLLGTSASSITSKVIAVRTPATDGEVHYGKITVYSTAGPQGQRQIEVFYTYQEIPNYIRF